MKARWLMAAALLLATAGAAVAGEADVLARFESGKDLDRVLVLEDEGLLVALSESDVFAHRLEDGARLLHDEGRFVPGVFHAVAEGRWLLVPADKGRMLRGYDLQSGEQAWEVEPPEKIKARSFHFATLLPGGVAMALGPDLICMDPATGELMWTLEEPALEGMLFSRGIPVVYGYEGGYGRRTVVLGARGSYVLDGDSGEILNRLDMNFAFVRQPVLQISGGSVLLMHAKGATALDLATGEEMWTAEDEVAGFDIFEPVEVDGRRYGFFGFSRTMALVDLEDGRLAWSSQGQTDVRLQEVRLTDGGIIVATGYRDQAKKRPEEINANGGFALAYGIDPAAGKLAWGPVVLGASTVNSLADAGEAIGKLGAGLAMLRGDVKEASDRMEETGEAARIPTDYVVYEGPWEVEGDLVYYVYAEDARVITELGDPWDEGAGEGLVRIDPATGEVVWRTGLELYNTWEDPMKRLLDMRSWSGSTPRMLHDRGVVPPPVFASNAAYLSAGGTLVKVDLATGEVLWRGPEIGLASDVVAGEGFVAGEVGAGRFAFKLDKRKSEIVEATGETKETGLFVLDAASGKTMAMLEMKHSPDLFLNHFDPETGALYLCDGEYLRRFDPGEGEFAWEMKLKKEVGEVGFKDGVVIRRSTGWIGSEPAFFGFHDTMETETEVVEGEMAHGAWWRDGGVLVAAEDGVMRVDPEGRVVWTHEWKWKKDDVVLAPTPTAGGLVVMIGDEVSCVNLEDGSLRWELEADDEGAVAMTADRTRLIIAEEERVILTRI